MESDGAEFDYLFDAPIETHDPALSPRSGGSSRSRSLSQSDLDADTSDVSSLHHSSQRFRKRRKRSYAERSVEPSSLLSVSPDSATSEGTVQEQGRCMRGEKDHPLDRSEPVSFAIDRRPRERRKGRSSVGSLARGVFIHRTQSRDTVSEVSRQKTNNLQTPGREPQVQQAFQECRKIRSSGRILRPEESASRTMAPEECADGRFGRATYGSLVPKGSSASKTSLSRLAAMQTPSADASQRATWKAARDLCIQSISPDLSFLFCILPDLASVQALIHPGDGHRPVACLENPDGLDNVIVKQLGPTNWLLAGTVRTEPKVSPVGTCPEDDLSNQELENASADENTTNLSDDEAEEQFSAKNQRWSEEDDRTLCQWVKAGRPWCWIVRQFPMRTPGSVRTRYSTLQRKSRQS
ncbi:hypothetical protein B0J12DRAFT_660231 [Macrophomina phaseolina]|uniref:Myb-like domain-containing protein n=1 Tax=Macrophomina phaseolina TaxID=35725 RepID=A0ABQ8GHW9_9PEZI|nr:hypothetical protein B0J12DRAFT_660231 [Macrophomina phaseolina]